MANKNVTIVYHKASNQPRMVIVDAENLNDPAWKPEGHEHINVDVEKYNSMTPEKWHQYLHSVVSSS